MEMCYNKVSIINEFFSLLTRVTKCFARRDGKIDLLGGAAPLSSRKTGYLLRVAHMIPIIFSAPRGGPSPQTDPLTHWLRFSRLTHKSMGTII